MDTQIYDSTITPFYHIRAKERYAMPRYYTVEQGKKYGRTNLRNTDPNLVEEIVE